MPAAMLQPALRLVDNVVVGCNASAVDATLLAEACADPNLQTGAVYILSGEDVTPVDLRREETDALITALVNGVDGDYVYEVGYLPEGDYTVAYTRMAGSDDPTT